MFKYSFSKDIHQIYSLQFFSECFIKRDKLILLFQMPNRGSFPAIIRSLHFFSCIPMLLFMVSEIMDSSAQSMLGNLFIGKCQASQYHIALCILQVDSDLFKFFTHLES